MAHDNSWLHARPTLIADAWFITIHGFDASEKPEIVSFYWPEGPQAMIPNTMVLMTVAAFAELEHKARQFSPPQSLSVG